MASKEFWRMRRIYWFLVLVTVVAAAEALEMDVFSTESTFWKICFLDVSVRESMFWIFFKVVSIS